MSSKMTGSIILVQLDERSHVTAFVSYGSGDPAAPSHRSEFTLPRPEDVTDCRDWLRQVLAALTEEA